MSPFIFERTVLQAPTSGWISSQIANTPFLHPIETCVIAISSSISISIAWDAVRTALGVLQDICIGVGLDPVQGGRAFYKTPSLPGKVGGKRGLGPVAVGSGKRDSHAGRGKRENRTPSGSNALPPHVNVTMFRQQENWVNPSVEAKSCTWKAVQEKKDVGNCK